jgi:hypothetical protein
MIFATICQVIGLDVGDSPPSPGPVMIVAGLEFTSTTR